MSVVIELAVVVGGVLKISSPLDSFNMNEGSTNPSVYRCHGMVERKAAEVMDEDMVTTGKRNDLIRNQRKGF
jgi:hypothetical protein